MGIAVAVLNLQKCSCLPYSPEEISRGKAGSQNMRKKYRNYKREKKKTHDLSSKMKVSDVSAGTVRYCFLVMSSQADLNCDVKPGNSV